MHNKILLHVENRYLKGIFLKSIVNAEMDILDIMDIDDLDLKLTTFGSKVCLAVFEITDWNMNAFKVEIERLKTTFPSIPVLAVVSKDTADVVSFAMRAGIRDVLLLPKNKELYRQIVQDKMEPYYQYNKELEMAAKASFKLIVSKENQEIVGSIRQSLKLELKRANRGRYSVAFVMAHLTRGTLDSLKSLFRRVKTFLRDTDKVFIVDEENFIGVFPFTLKDHLPVIEQKFREAYEKEFGKPSYYNKLFIFTATYPDDDTDLDLLLSRLENGISNGMLIDSIKSPFNALSKAEIENYKQKIEEYRKFF